MGRARRRKVGGVDRLPSGRWRIRLADPASGERVSLGTFPTKAAAEIAFAQAVSDQQQGVWVAPDRGRITLTEYASSWLDTRLTSRGEPLRPRTRELYEGFLRLHILPAFGARPLSQLTTAGIRSWHANLLAQGPGASTAAKCYRLLRTILSTAVEDGLLVVNPCMVKGAGIEPADERQPPSLAQVYALAEAVQPQYRCLVLLAAFGGLRRGELVALTRRDIDLLHRTVDVRRQRQDLRGGGQLVGPPKTEAGRRTVALPAALVPELEHHLTRWVGPHPDGLVFPGAKGGPLRVSVWQPEWSRKRPLSAWTTCISTISVTSPGRWRRPRGPAPES